MQLELDLIGITGHISKNTPVEHIQKFYNEFRQIKKNKYDGLIVTGAPVELLHFEEVNYWEEMKEILDWARTNVTSRLFICWSAQAALYHYYGILKHPLEKKMFGIFEHRVNDPFHPLLRGFDEVFYAPHSRHTETRKEDIKKIPELSVIAESVDAGAYMISGHDGAEIFITGHSEYAPETLDNEYKRDLNKKLPVEMPFNYYRENNPDKPPLVRWRSHSNLMFTNCLNYFCLSKHTL